MLWDTRVSAEQRAVSVGADDGDGLDFVDVERGDVVVVLQEGDRFLGSGAGELFMRVGADHAIDLSRIHVRIVEEAHLKLPKQHGRDQLVELRFLEHAPLHQLDQVEIAVRVGQLDVHTGVDCKGAGFLLVPRDEVAVRVRPIAQLPDGVVVRDNEALEGHLLAEHIFEQPLVRVRGDAVDFVIRGHDGDGLGFPQSLFERVEEGFAQHAFGDVGRSAVHTGFRLAMADEMLQRSEDVFLVAEIAIALEAAYGRDAEARDEIRVFAVSLFDAAPARLSRHIDDRRQSVMRAAQSGFVRCHREELLDQVRVERGAQRDRLREARAVGRGVAMQALFVEHHRDAKAGVLEEKLLDGVGEFRHRASLLSASGIGGSPDLAEAALVAEGLLRFGEVEIALLVDQFLSLFLPDAEHLRRFLFEGHPREKVLDAPGRRQFRIFVGGRRLARRTCRSR